MSWSVKPLSEVADFALGKMLDQVRNKGELLPYLANVNVRWGEFDLDDLREMRFESHEIERYSLRNGDIVMCEGGEPGRCSQWKGQSGTIMFQKALHRIRPHSCLDSRFLYYFFLQLGKTGGFSPHYTGSTIKHLPREKLAKVEIRFPEIDAQQAIASVLEVYDDLIENNRRRIALLEESARLLYREWFVKLRFPGHEESARTDGVPDGWDFDRLDSALTLQRGFDLPNSARKPGEIPIYASSGVNGFHDVAKVEGPGVVTGRSGTLGLVHYVPGDFWPLNTALWVKDFLRVTPVFAYFMLAEMNLAQYNSGASVPTLDRKVVHPVKVLIPPKELMTQFGEHVDPVFQQIECLQAANSRLASARDALLPKLMSGALQP